ncbi:DNA pilot protein [Peromfec virus RodF8_12]|uniref:DNA pilot protein n=1 Tax=Peromfec virus RodF8_12 TaxID=2929358 RepID=A0A976N2L8_9VIRU|nr:DNA pilot protein [Peromfec virus RodF8_12]
MITEKFNLHFCWIAAAASAAGSILSGILGKSSAYKQNIKMFDHAAEWQDQQRIAQQEYQTSEREAQNQWSEEQYLKYNSPAAMKQQLLDAGMNPNIANSNSIGNSVSSGSSGAAPSPSMPNVPYENPNESALNWSHGFQNIAQSVKALTDAKKSGAETDRIESLLSGEVEFQRLSNQAQSLLNGVNLKYMDAKAQAELNTLLVGITNGNLTSEQLRHSIGLLGQQLKLNQNQLDTWYSTWEMEMRESESRIANNEAHAALAKSTASYTEEQKKTIQPLIAKLGSEVANNLASAGKLREEGATIANTRMLTIETMVTQLEGMDYDNAMKQLKNMEQQISNFNYAEFGTKEVGSGMLGDLVNTLGDKIFGDSRHRFRKKVR